MIVRPATKEVILLSTTGSLVGVFKRDKITYGESAMILQPGDKVLLYTDAIMEVRDGSNHMLEEDELTSFLVSKCDEPITRLVDMVYQFGIDYSGKPAYDDDFTMIGFEVMS
jgi:serine phosphatase RsbU (regulator of sigma subunit)